MKGGTTAVPPTSQTKHTDSMTTKKPTAEQIRYAQLLNTEDSKATKDKIKQVMDVTGFSIDEVSIALHDYNFDTEATINALLEGRQDQSEWVMRTTKKKKHQAPVTQGIDTIIPTSQTTQPTTTAPTSSKPGGPRQPRGKGRNRQSGEQNHSSEKDNKHEGTERNNERNAGESVRGRGSREDRGNDRKPGGRGGPPRRGGRGGGRPGRSFQSRGRDRPNRFGGGNRNASNPSAVNGPTVNGTEMWGDEDDVSKEKETEHAGDLIPPTTEEWGVEEWTPVEQSVTSSTDDTLFNNAVSSSHTSWPTNADSSVVSWDVDMQSGSKTTDPTVPTTDSRQKNPENTAHFTPESVDMAIIHSKLASNQPSSKDQYSAVEFSMPRIPLPGELQNIHNHQDSLSKLFEKASLASSIGVSSQSSSTTVQAQPQRQPRTSRTKKSQKSQIPVQAVEMPGSMNDSLDVQFGNLEFGGDSVSSPRKKEEFPAPLPVVEDTRSDEQSSTTSSESPSPPLESQHVGTSLPSASISTPITIATTASASSSVTTLEDSSPRHFQHPSPRAQQPPLVPQVPKQITPEPIPLPSQLESRDNSIPTKSPLSNDQPNSSASLQPSGISSPSLSGNALNQSGSSSPLRPALSSTMQKDITLETRGYQKHVTQPTVPTTKDKLSTSSLSSSAVSTSVSRNDLSSVEPLQPPPGVSVPLTVNQATSSTSSAFTTVTMSGTGKPVSHTTKPSLPPGVLPLNTLYGMQQGLIHAYPMPYGYEDLQRLPMSPYYDMPAFQAAGRDGLSTTFHGDQKFGRTDASSPVPTSLNQTVTLPQAHLQQQAFINATTMPHPYGYGGLAFYPGAGMMAGSTTANGDKSAVKNGMCSGEVNDNSNNKEANGCAPQKPATKSVARGETHSVVLMMLSFAWFLAKCLVGYVVLLFVLAPPLVPIFVVYFVLKMIERVVVKLTSGEIALSGQDALWQQYSDENRLIINGLVYVENKSNFEDCLNKFRQAVLERMVNAKKPNGELLYPRARCCIRPGYFQYFFQEDKSFRIENHVFKWEGEVPSSKEELASIVSKLSNEAFPKGRAPWYYCCIPTNYGDQDVATLFRMSHSVADGVSLARFLINQLPDKTTPQKEPQKFSASHRALLTKALLIAPSFLIKLLLSFADQNKLHGPKISGTKKVVWHEGFELKLIKQIKTVAGTTVNDVLMSCLSRAIRQYFQRKGVDTPTDFTASIPVDVRLSAACKRELSFENKFSLIFLKLATATEGVLEQLRETKARMDKCKFSGEPLASAAAMILTNELCPESLIRPVNTFIAQKASCVLSNVPGPQYFLTVSGQRIKYMTFWPPQRNNIGVGVSIFTYAGQVVVGVQSDVTVMPDPEIIIEEFGNTVNEMAKCVLHTDAVNNGHSVH